MNPSLLCFRKLLVAKKFKEKKEKGEVSKVSVEKFLSQIAETFCSGTLYSFISFGCRKCLCFRGLCHDFPWNFFCLTVPNRFVEEPFRAVFQKISVG